MFPRNPLNGSRDMPVYVIRNKFTNDFMTTHIVNKDTPGVIGFSSKSHAYSFRRLMNYKVHVEKWNTTTMIRLCHNGCLDFVCYHNSGNYTVHEKPPTQTQDVDQFRFLLETAFRYY